MNLEKIRKNDMLKIQGKVYQVEEIIKSAFPSKSGKVIPHLEFKLVEKGTLNFAELHWNHTTNGKIFFSKTEELEAEDISKSH